MYPDWRGAEETWYKQQRIFPIMHLVGVRQELTVKHPSLLTEVYKGFMESAQIALANLSVLQASKTMLPWLVAEYDRTRALMGHDFWPYGVGPNRAVLDWTLRNLACDGLLARPVAIDELFAPGFY
jgi:4,5-dihydroxyphthalate decarboxylase